MSEPTCPPSAAVSNLRLLRYGSLAILGGYVIATCYKVGLVSRILPPSVNASLESAVETVKQRTLPIGNAARFALVRSHLTNTYGLAASGMVTVAAGVMVFCAYPTMPIAIPMALTVVPALVLLAVPKSYMLPAARHLCFFLSLFSTGYALGPIGWVAQDSLLVFVMLTGCTMTGICLPLYITRGMISYVISAQLLSSALAVALVTAPKQSRDSSVFKKLKDQEGVQIILNGDVNVIFTMQLMSNVGICLLHTLPTIFRFVAWEDSEEDLLASADAVKEAFAICAGITYVIYRAVRWGTRQLISRVMSEHPQSATGGVDENTWLAMSNHPLDVNRTSGVVSGVVMVLCYVRAVSLLQKSDVAGTLDDLRHLCAKISPVAVMLGSGVASK